MLWLEQSVNFHLEGYLASFSSWSYRPGTEKDARELFKARSQYLLNNNPDIHQIIWFDAAGKIWGESADAHDGTLGWRNGRDGDTQNQAFEMAAELESLRIPTPIPLRQGVQFEMYMPVSMKVCIAGRLLSSICSAGF